MNKKKDSLSTKLMRKKKYFFGGIYSAITLKRVKQFTKSKNKE